MKRSPFNLLLVASFVIAALIALPVVSVLANIFTVMPAAPALAMARLDHAQLETGHLGDHGIFRCRS